MRGIASRLVELRWRAVIGGTSSVSRLVGLSGRESRPRPRGTALRTRRRPSTPQLGVRARRRLSAADCAGRGFCCVDEPALPGGRRSGRGAGVPSALVWSRPSQRQSRKTCGGGRTWARAMLRAPARRADGDRSTACRPAQRVLVLARARSGVRARGARAPKEYPHRSGRFARGSGAGVGTLSARLPRRARAAARRRGRSGGWCRRTCRRCR